MIVPAPNPLRVVDLFSGCGGLSLGFEQCPSESGVSPYEVVLAVDNWKPAIEVFCRNHPAPSESGVQVGRLADLSWFNHASEALLYYLAHFSAVARDDDLSSSLDQIGFNEFVAELAEIDAAFQTELERIVASKEHAEAIACTERSVFTLAITKSALGKLHISSLRDLRLADKTLPWADERLIARQSTPKKSVHVEPAVLASAKSHFNSVIEAIDIAASSTGRGQHKGNAAKMATLSRYFASSVGEKFQSAWVAWYSSRLAARQAFCLSSYPRLREMYTPTRRVSVVLGGPPCKGFSRIGRAVIRELRDQGAHAWACDRFGDERNALMYRYVIFLEALRPDVFLFENVSNFASTLKTPDGELDAPQLLEDLIDSLECEDLHYRVGARIVRAREHGIPQARERYIMCGVNAERQAFDPEHVLALKKYHEEVTLGDAVAGLPKAKVFREDAEGVDELCEVAEPSCAQSNSAGSAYFSWIRSTPNSPRKSRKTDAHVYRRPRPDDAKLYKLLAPGVRWMDLKTPAARTLTQITAVLDELLAHLPVKAPVTLIKRAQAARTLLNDSLALRLLLEQLSQGLDEPHHLLADGYLSNGSGQHGDWLERLSATKPCKTIVAHIGKDTYGYVHPFEPRPISIREAARVQSFPDWFQFGGVGVVDAYSMIGNAVPPFLSAQLAQTIYSSMNAARLKSRNSTPAPRGQRELSLEL